MCIRDRGQAVDIDVLLRDTCRQCRVPDAAGNGHAVLGFGQDAPLVNGKADHRRAVIIASGGQGADEEVSEAEAMRTYLVEERGVPADAVIEEDRSTTTMENLRNSKAIMDARSGAGAYRAAVVTSDYHVFRTAEYAHKIGLAADGVGSRTARYFWPTAFIREYVAVSNAHCWPFVVIFVFWLPFAAIALFQL